ncbi:MAG: hypothetical protein NT02SARS_1194 [SAR86 cluster bacterium SAR86B]|uniref:Uncharacterized protein n=1 Tax=SAR86 cluster bacterium SAR86B TaxID=1123867 RepID=J5KIF6_9GAMM|nr:MAG: hypothetical protein NT02SARS_1194 [SAR86 cluster bacterium SAR86B]
MKNISIKAIKDTIINNKNFSLGFKTNIKHYQSLSNKAAR